MRATATLLVSLLVSSLIAVGGCGSDGADDDEQAPRPAAESSAAESNAGPLVGEWVATNKCEPFVEAMAEAGLEEFATKFDPDVGVGKADPSDPCKGTTPAKHSHSFSEDGEFASYDEQGEQVDFGTYEVAEEGTLTLSRPPFESEVRYRVEGDAATFELVVPECTDKQCQLSTALGISTFFPHTYERVK